MIADFSLLVLSVLILIVPLFTSPTKDSYCPRLHSLSLVGIAVVFLLLLVYPGESILPTYKLTSLGLVFKVIFLLSAFLAISLSKYYFKYNGDNKIPLQYQSEFVSMIGLCTFGMFVMVSSTDLLSLFVGMELATIPLYFLAGWRNGDSKSIEAASKYILVGGLSTGLMLFGFSYLYGASGSLDLVKIGEYIAMNQGNPLIWFSVLFVLSAIGFKLTLFPFHMWAPDVYEGAPTPITAFLSVSSKTAGVAFIIIMLSGPFTSLWEQLNYPILLLAGATMLVGNLGAMRQRHLRRLMGYSSIAQAGYIFMALAGPRTFALEAILFYMLLYTVTNYTMFFIIAHAGRERGEGYECLRGLGKHHPALAAVLSLCVFSLAGIPPVAGFVGKFWLFTSVAKSGYYFFILFAAVNSTISLYYYLLLLKEAYIFKGESLNHKAPFSYNVTVGVLGLGVLILGLLPSVVEWISTNVQNI